MMATKGSDLGTEVPIRTGHNTSVAVFAGCVRHHE
jgi:hypothetical protein